MDTTEKMEKRTGLQKYRNILHSRHFRSSFTILIGLLVLIFFLGGILIVSKTFRDLHTRLEEAASQTASQMQEFLTGMKSSAVFVGTLPSVNTNLALPYPSIDNLSQMIDDVTPYSSVYSCESICIYLNLSERVFDSSGGMYDYSDFYDQELLDTLTTCKSNEFWLFDHDYERYYAPKPAVSVVMYARTLPLYSSDTQGYISVACPMQHLNQIAERLISPTGYTACVSWQNQLLWTNFTSASEAWDNSRSLAKNETAFFPKNKYVSSSSEQTVCTFYLTPGERLKTALRPLSRWIAGCAAAAVCMCMISMLYSALMLSQLDAMMRKIGITPYTEGSSDDMDEFIRMNDALDRMNAKMTDIDKLMLENRQLVRERLLTGILYNYVDIKTLRPEYEDYGIAFPEPGLAVILLFLPALNDESDYTQREQLMLLARTNATNAFSVLGTAYSLYMERDVICILLNTSLNSTLQEELSRICVLVKENMKKTLSLYPLFSIGICSQTSPSPWKAYQLARRNYIFTAADTDDFVLFGWQNEFTSTVDRDLLALMSQAIIDKDSTKLNELIGLFHSRYLEGAQPSEFRRLCIITLSTIYATILDMSGSLPDSPLHISLRKLETSDTVEECDKNFRVCLLGLLNAKNSLSIESQTYIYQTVQYLEQHYREAITIPQIAEFVGLSSVYLNKLFKLATGKTLSEYLNYYRTQSSLSLLTDTKDTINEISAKVGYTDVRSYIRFFKKFYHMTPGEYRKENLK